TTLTRRRGQLARKMIVLAYLAANSVKKAVHRSFLHCGHRVLFNKRAGNAARAGRDAQFARCITVAVRFQNHHMHIAVWHYAIRHDLSDVINHYRLYECEARSWQDLSAQVDHGPVLPQIRMENVSVTISGCSRHLSA